MGTTPNVNCKYTSVGIRRKRRIDLLQAVHCRRRTPPPPSWPLHGWCASVIAVVTCRRPVVIIIVVRLLSSLSSSRHPIVTWLPSSCRCRGHRCRTAVVCPCVCRHVGRHDKNGQYVDGDRGVNKKDIPHLRTPIAVNETGGGGG